MLSVPSAIFRTTQQDVRVIRRMSVILLNATGKAACAVDDLALARCLIACVGGTRLSTGFCSITGRAISFVPPSDRSALVIVGLHQLAITCSFAGAVSHCRLLGLTTARSSGYCPGVTGRAVNGNCAPSVFPDWYGWGDVSVATVWTVAWHPGSVGRDTASSARVHCGRALRMST